MTGNKYRVSVAGFARDGISNDPSLEKPFGRAMYRWGIWVEPKHGQGKGRLYHVEEHPPMSSAAGPVPGGWRFGPRDSNARTIKAIGLLQGQRPTPWAEEFEVEGFMDYAYSRFKGWYLQNNWRYTDYKESYVKRKF